MEFQKVVRQRRSVRKFDPEKPLDEEIVRSCVELATLAPNSSNMQLWEFYHVTAPEVLEKLSEYCFGQNAARSAQQMLVVVVRKDLWRKRAKTHVDHLKNVFGKKDAHALSKREKFALNYYKKLVPFTYFDFLGIFGLLKYLMSWSIGLFRPIYRQTRNSDMRIVAHKSAALAAQNFMLAMTDAGYDTCPMEGSDTLRIKKFLGIPRSAEINMVIGCGVRLPEGIYGHQFRIPFEEVYVKL